MKVKRQPAFIEEWYERVMALDKNQRKSKKEKKRLREKEKKKILTY